VVATQEQLNERNAAFWNELCGTGFAQALGITGTEPDALARYDAAYLAYYPYLGGYVDRFDLRGRRVLEIGLGYGTLGSLLVGRGADYHGLDISPGPVEMMRHRLDLEGMTAATARVQVGSALAIPHEDASFDFVYTIGCLHHTGDIAAAVLEVRRVLRPGGSAVVMVYNKRSLRQLLRVDLRRLAHRKKALSEEAVRGLYDTDTTGEAAPHTDYLTSSDVRRCFNGFSAVQIDRHNFDDIIRKGKIVVPRSRILGTAFERLFGLDLYIVAER
jgi:SAM-dependent methyltransferase